MSSSEWKQGLSSDLGQEIKGKLFLIPNSLGGRDAAYTIPAYVRKTITSLREFVVEDVKSARRYFRSLDKEFPIDDTSFHLLDKRSNEEDLMQYLTILLEGRNLGLVSEAGLPAVADPGSELIRIAHQNNITVIPLVGPSSIMLALMASGLNGQSFTFHGYLPVRQKERRRELQELERDSFRLGRSQIFMETPYRNKQLLDDVIATCRPTTDLCIAVDLTLYSELVKTKTVEEWQKNQPNIHKRPAVFVMMS